jgi:NAD(P)H-hydrate repair Nnr-like enzyme with NAD(P)H-hydrate dehydratase domain
VRAARALAEATMATVLLKGSGTIVATPGDATSINPTGDARLSTAGSGDVLAGWIGGCWAAHAGTMSPHRVAQGAVWLHGAATAQGPLAGPLRASMLIEAMVRERDALAATRDG